MSIELGIEFGMLSSLPANLDGDAIREALNRTDVDFDPPPDQCAGLLVCEFTGNSTSTERKTRQPALRPTGEACFNGFIRSLDQTMQVELDRVCHADQPLAVAAPGQAGANHDTTIQTATAAQATSASHISADAIPGSRGKPAARP